jgi:hypothetical protein
MRKPKAERQGNEEDDEASEEVSEATRLRWSFDGGIRHGLG